MPGIATLLDQWTSEPGQPRLTWYGPDGERVELTGRVMANWVAKATNLLAEEADLQAAGHLELDLPVHWRTAVWALAAWTCGASAGTGPGGAPEALVTTVDRLGGPPPAEVTIVIALPALAMSVDDAPPGTLDGAAELMSQPDVLIHPVPAPGTGPAAGWRTDGETVDLLAGTAGSSRVLLDATTVSVTEFLASAVRAWGGGGSVVLVGDPEADLERIAQQEGTDGGPPAG
ncbi:TIGR03089 family protein [Ruania suaedae]|uniref:TIGR03089 family protein n=1 Tax=Ruania suaedae TaxID=2897774 RepID=UPI001E49FC04|nr:TIGR03089 family protein [Ruania suaedae]UFU02222.1 TIGR03089 family protein [Ruania suaedae]